MKRIKELLKDKTIVTLIIAFIAIIGIVVGLIFYKFDFKKEVELIDFSKLKQSEIIEWFNKEFETEENVKFKREYSETVAKDDVISQSIKSGELITKETVVEIILSNGYDPSFEVTLPDFVGEKYTKDRIEKFFADNKFSDITYEYVVSEQEKDLVLDVNVKDKAKRNDLILVTLSVGDNPELIEVDVPDFSAYTLLNAKAWGSSNAITIKVSYVFSETFEEGKIISQSVKAKEKINGGSTITLQVSSGKGVEVDDLAGMTYDEADKWSDKVGVYIDSIYIYHDTVKEGLVIYTDPKPGTILRKGAVVDIYISKGVDPENIKVKVENKVNSSETDFLAYIKKLGLKAVKSTSYYSDSIASGNVMSHTTGDIKMTQSVEYNLSLGTYKINVADFEGKAKSNGDQIVNSANSLKAGISLNISESVYNDNYSKDILFECSSNAKTVTCKLSKGSLMTVENYVGSNKQANFSSNGVNYVVIFDSEYYEGSNYGDIYSQSINAGERVETGATVELYARKGTEQKAEITNVFAIYDGAHTTYEATYNSLISKLGAFQNLSIIKEESPEFEQGSGKIISMSVNGDPNFKSGLYPVSSTIVVVVKG